MKLHAVITISVAAVALCAGFLAWPAAETAMRSGVANGRRPHIEEVEPLRRMRPHRALEILLPRALAAE